MCSKLKFLLALLFGFVPFLASAQVEKVPPDLGTRKNGSDWEGFLGPTSNSISSEKGLKPWPKQGPKVLWVSPMGEGYSTVAVSRGRAFLFDRTREGVRLRCVESENGKELWKFIYPSNYEDAYGYSNGPRCYPVVEKDRVYIYGAEGMLHCLDVQTGKLNWKLDVNRQFGVIQNFFGVGSTPIIEGNLLIAQVGGSPKGSETVPFQELKGNQSGIVAFDKFTGKVVYQVSDDQASYAVPMIASINGKRVGLQFGRTGLYSFDPSNGKPGFNFPWRARILESVNAANPVVVGNKVLVSETYGPGSALLEVNENNYKVLWDDQNKIRDKSLQCHWNTPVYIDGFLYGSSGRHKSNAELRCVEFATGKVKWSEPGLSRSSILAVDGHLVVQAEDGFVHLLKVNPEKFDLVQSVLFRDSNGLPLLQEPCWCAPVLSHGLLYLRGRNALVCVELMDAK